MDPLFDCIAELLLPGPMLWLSYGSLNRFYGWAMAPWSDSIAELWLPGPILWLNYGSLNKSYG